MRKSLKKILIDIKIRKKSYHFDIDIYIIFLNINSVLKNTNIIQSKIIKIFYLMKGLAVGLNKGFITTKLSSKRATPSTRKGKLGKRVSLIRQIVRESTGFAPYEKRVFYEYISGYWID